MTTTPIVVSKTYVDGEWRAYYPQTSSSAIITDENGRLVTDAQISAWGAKADTSTVTEALSSAKGYADTKIADLVDGAPESLDTLAELATALQEIEGTYDGLLSVIGEKATKVGLTEGLALKADLIAIADMATKTEVNASLNKKADKTELATKANASDIISVTLGNTAPLDSKEGDFFFEIISPRLK